MNLKRELPENKNFSEILAEGRKSWNNELSKIKVEMENTTYGISNKIKFYSSFYRTILFPRQFHEYNKAPQDDRSEGKHAQHQLFFLTNRF